MSKKTTTTSAGTATDTTTQKATALAVKTSQNQAIDGAMSSLNKQFGPGTIMKLGERQHLDIPVLSTGNVVIDQCLGAGGIPKGRIIEIYGPESSGKTTFCLNLIAQCQKEGGTAAFIDVEHAVDPKYAKIVGVNLDTLLFSQPDCGEDALNIAESLISTGAVGLIIIDSVAALVSKKELEGEMGDVTMGAQARLMSQAMRRLTGITSKNMCTVVFTNQIREKIGVLFGSPETTSGGRALKFFASIRLDIRRKDQIKLPDGKIVGNLTKLKVVKNKVAPPFTECEFDIMYDEGISHTNSLIDLAVSSKLVEKKGSWFSYEGKLIAQGKEQLRSYLKENPTLFETLQASIKKVAASAVTVGVPVEDPEQETAPDSSSPEA
jgi:recombination protein RecA